MNEILIILPEEIKKDIQLHTDLAIGEISWIGDIVWNSNKISVTNIFLIEQDTTRDKTKLNDEAYAKFIMDYFNSGKDPANLKLWVHSHGNGGVFWSPDDEAAIETHNRADFFVSIVVNKYGDLLARVDFFKPLRAKVDNVRVFTPTIYPPEVIKNTQEKIDALVHYHELPKMQLPVFAVLTKKGKNHEPRPPK